MCQQSIWDSQTIGNKTIHCNDDINDTINERCANNQFEALKQLATKLYTNDNINDTVNERYANN